MIINELITLDGLFLFLSSVFYGFVESGNICIFAFVESGNIWICL